MGKFTLFHSNAAAQAELTGGSWETNSPLEYLQDPRPTSKARSTDLLLASTQFDIAFQRSTPLLGIQLVSTNLSSGAKVRITAYTDATLTTVQFVYPAADEWEQIGDPPTPSLDLPWSDANWWSGVTPRIDPDNAGLDVQVFFGQSITAKFWKVEIDNQTNTEGFVEIGVLFMGQAYVPTYNFAPDAEFSRESRTSFADSDAGSRYFRRRRAVRRAIVAWPQLPLSEVMQEIDEIVRIHDLDQQVYVCLDPEDADNRTRTAFLATMSSLPKHRLLNVFFDGEIGASAGFEFLESI